MGGKSDPPPPPDYSGVAEASEKAAELQYKLGSEQLAWAKEQYASDRELTDSVVQSFLASQNENLAMAREDRARYKQVFQPLEDDLIADAASYASPERTQLEMGRAQANVAQQFDGQRQQALQRLEGFGVDPSSTRYAALDVGVRAAQAAAEAAAGNQAAQQTDAIGRALRSEAINVGRGLPGQIASSYGTALQAGNQAVGSNLATTASGVNSMGTPTQYMGLGNQAVGTWGNTLHMGYQDQMAAYNAQQDQSSGWGSIAGTIAGGIFSKLPMFAEGGAVDDESAEPYPDNEAAEGEGAVYMHQPVHGGAAVPVQASPSMGGATDDVPAMLNAGEFVLPRDVVQWLGEEKLQKLIETARKGKGEAGAKPKIGMAPQQAPAVDTTG